MDYRNLIQVNPEDYVLMPEDYSIKSRLDGKIYTTTKDYIGKLFSDLGYKNLSEVETLIKYGVPVKTDLKLKTLALYVDKDSEEFICMTSDAFLWFNKIIKEFDYYSIVVTDLTGEIKPVCQVIVSDDTKQIEYALYFNFIKETFELYALTNYQTMTKIHKASMKRDEGDEEIIRDTLSNIDWYITREHPDKVSPEIALRVLEKAGIVKKKGKMYAAKDPDQKIFSSQISVDEFLEKIFLKNPSIGVDHSDLCAIIITESVNKCDIPIRDFLFFFTEE